jgi:peptide/nickel transport system permease protein
MLVYVIRRLGQASLTVAAMACLVFIALYAVGNPVEILASPTATQQEIVDIARRLGLDRPLHEQFGRFLCNVLHGDLGRSYVYAEPVLDVVLGRLPATLELAVTALVMAIVIGLPLGILAGLKFDGAIGRSIMSGSILGFSLPNFWVGLMLVLLFAVQLRILPASGRGQTVDVAGVPLAIFTWDGIQHLILPAATLALYKTALIVRIAQAGVREVMHQDYIRFARAKGLAPFRIIRVHVLRNILIPIVTVLGLELGSMIALAVVTETVFAYPGMGKLLIDSINRLDRPVIVAYLMLTVLIFVSINLIVDLIYVRLDPRVRLTGAEG